MIECVWSGVRYALGEGITLTSNPGQAPKVRQVLVDGGWTVTESRRGGTVTLTAVCQ